MVEVLRLLFSGETVSFSGEELSIGPTQLNYGGKEIDIFLAGRGPKMLELGAQKADGFYLSYIYKKHLPDVIAKLRSENRPDTKRFNIVYSTMLVTEEKELEDAKAQLSFRLVDSPLNIKEEIGMTQGDEAKIKDALREGGPQLAGKFVKEEWVEEFTLTGNLESCREELFQFFEAGIDEYQLPVYELQSAEKDIERAATFFKGELP
tara:strand:- start:197 stop:817 length:621 start_codon:yes stop_codon:yes gene_type:complete